MTQKNGKHPKREPVPETVPETPAVTLSPQDVTQLPPPATNGLPKIFEAISNVQSEISSIGVSKSRTNVEQKYRFRGIDEILNALSPLFKKYKMFVLPYVVSERKEERPSRSGGILIYSHVEVEFTFYSAIDGSFLKAKTLGEAMDSADKATNKATSAAMKYVCILTFCIPTEGDNDADLRTHELAPPSQGAPEREPEVAAPRTVSDHTGTKHTAFDPTQERIDFGKYGPNGAEGGTEGLLWSEIPPDYFDWLIKNASRKEIKVKAEATIKWRANNEKKHTGGPDVFGGAFDRDPGPAPSAPAPATAPGTSDTIRQQNELLKSLAACTTLEALERWGKNNKADIDTLPEAIKTVLRASYQGMQKKLEAETKAPSELQTLVDTIDAMTDLPTLKKLITDKTAFIQGLPATDKTNVRTHYDAACARLKGAN